MADEKLERIYTIPLGDAYQRIRNKRTPRAIDLIRTFLRRHMKAREAEVYISNALNKTLWERGIQKPPRKIKVRAIKQGESVKAYLADEKVEEKPKKVEKAKPEETKKTEEKPKETKKPETKEPEKKEVPEKPKEVKKTEEKPKKVEEKPKEAKEEVKSDKKEKSDKKNDK